jgi:electron transfer flavoprotein beta subunit
VTPARPHTLLFLRRHRADPEHACEEEVIGRCERAALATALRLRRQLGGALTAISVGPRREDRVLAMALRAGCDHAARAHDPLLDGVDYLGVARVLAAAARRLSFDLVVCGDRSQDELQGALGPAVADLLDVPHLTGLVDVQADGGALVLRQRSGSQLHTFRGRPPLVLCVAAYRPAAGDEPPGGHGARAGAIEHLDLAELGIDGRELSHRRQFLGQPRAARPGCNATLVNSGGELVSALVSDHLLG